MEYPCSEMLATHTLVRIDVVREIKINCEIINAWLLVLLNFMHEIVMVVTIKVLCLCVFKLIGKLIINNCLRSKISTYLKFKLL